MQLGSNSLGVATDRITCFAVQNTMYLPWIVRLQSTAVGLQSAAGYGP